MYIQKKISDDGREMTLFLPEKFNFEIHGEFRDAYITEKKAKSMIVDMNKTNYMDSSALGMLLQLKEHAEKCNSKISVKNVHHNIMQIMQIAHFDKLFNIS